jgi:hypothetical protein
MPVSVLRNILTFMERVDLKGSEAVAWVQAVKEIQDAIARQELLK